MKTEISLQNVWRTYTIDGEGKLQSTYGVKKDAVAKDVDAVLANASWNVDPSLIPADLQEAWLAIEFGNFPAAAKTLQRALKSKKEEIKTAADALNEFVQAKLEPSAKVAAEFREGEDYWEAYKAYMALEAEYSGYFDESIDIKAILKELKSEEIVKSESAALKQLQNASAIAARSGFPKVVGRLKKIIDKYPDTEAAATAQKLLTENGAD